MTKWVVGGRKMTIANERMDGMEAGWTDREVEGRVGNWCLTPSQPVQPQGNSEERINLGHAANGLQVRS